MIILPEPLIQISLQLFDRMVNLLPKSHLVKLFLDRTVKAFANSIGLWMTGFGLGVINVFDGQVQLVLVVFQGTTKFGSAIRQDA